MDTARILTELRSERERIDRAITALEALDSTAVPTRKTTPQSAPKSRGRRMSPAARKRMSEMMKNRWAQRKQTSKPQASARTAASTKTAKKGGLTPAGRRRLSANMKKRWAEKKKAAAKA